MPQENVIQKTKDLKGLIYIMILLFYYKMRMQWGIEKVIKPNFLTRRVGARPRLAKSRLVLAFGQR